MNKMIGVMAGAALLSAATVGAASGNGLSAQDFIILFRSNDSIAKTYSGSIESGIASINTLFCKPAELVLTASQAVDLTDNFIAKHPLEQPSHSAG